MSARQDSFRDQPSLQPHTEAKRSLARRSILGVLAAATFTPTLRAADDFQRLLESFVEPTGGDLGFAMHHVESGEILSIRGAERFPMASTYKLPIALAVLDLVDRGELSLLKSVRLTPSSLRMGLGDGAMAKLIGTEGHDFTVRQLLERMIEDSDNVASDALLELIGVAAVNARLSALGVEGIRVDRPEVELLFDFIGAPSAAPSEGWSMERLRERYNSVTPAQRTAAMSAFLDDPRDTATPDAMLALLGKIHRNEVLQPVSAKRLMGHLTNCKTGNNRLRGQLPPDTVFAHRTGTSDSTDGITGVTNDLGILTLPGRKGHVLLVAFLRRAKGKMAEREAVLARIGRAVFERYVGA